MSQRATSRLRTNWFFHNLEWDLIDNIVGDLRIIEFGENFDFKPFEKFARMKYLVASLIIQLSQSEDFTGLDHYLAKLRFQKRQRIREHILGLQPSTNPLKLTSDWKQSTARPQNVFFHSEKKQCQPTETAHIAAAAAESKATGAVKKPPSRQGSVVGAQQAFGTAVSGSGDFQMVVESSKPDWKVRVEQLKGEKGALKGEKGALKGEKGALKGEKGAWKGEKGAGKGEKGKGFKGDRHLVPPTGIDSAGGKLKKKLENISGI